jgi:hypothetical protein
MNGSGVLRCIRTEGKHNMQNKPGKLRRETAEEIRAEFLRQVNPDDLLEGVRAHLDRYASLVIDSDMRLIEKELETNPPEIPTEAQQYNLAIDRSVDSNVRAHMSEGDYRPYFERELRGYEGLGSPRVEEILKNASGKMDKFRAEALLLGVKLEARSNKRTPGDEDGR